MVNVMGGEAMLQTEVGDRDVIIGVTLDARAIKLLLCPAMNDWALDWLLVASGMAMMSQLPVPSVEYM